MTILQKTTKAGDELVISLGRNHLGPALDVDLAGKRILSGEWLQQLAKPSGDMTHHIGGKIGICAADAATINAALKAARQPISLRDQRGALVSTLRGLQADRDAAFERGHESDGSAAYAAAKPFDAKIEAARQAVATFDVAHPEVLAEISAEKTERATRNQWL